jgi:hypothetical protein
MALAFKKGTPVKQVVEAPLEGVITAITLDETSGEATYLVETEDGHARWFSEKEIETV